MNFYVIFIHLSIEGFQFGAFVNILTYHFAKHVQLYNVELLNHKISLDLVVIVKTSQETESMYTQHLVWVDSLILAILMREGVVIFNWGFNLPFPDDSSC